MDDHVRPVVAVRGLDLRQDGLGLVEEGHHRRPDVDDHRARARDPGRRGLVDERGRAGRRDVGREGGVHRVRHAMSARCELGHEPQPGIDVAGRRHGLERAVERHGSASSLLFVKTRAPTPAAGNTETTRPESAHGPECHHLRHRHRDRCRNRDRSGKEEKMVIKAHAGPLCAVI
ncbi:MAG TPA: hypothetical protein VGO80_19845 [Solirubrobacteraceae bacterium]|nr:hypothetical protein [Solirubrobacteraceae bacterium]